MSQHLPALPIPSVPSSLNYLQFMISCYSFMPQSLCICSFPGLEVLLPSHSGLLDELLLFLRSKCKGLLFREVSLLIPSRADLLLYQRCALHSRVYLVVTIFNYAPASAATLWAPVLFLLSLYSPSALPSIWLLIDAQFTWQN